MKQGLFTGQVFANLRQMTRIDIIEDVCIIFHENQGPYFTVY